ncbi:MAG: hypothetical protein EOO78_31590, partial [Oxalobacteraceae bacterium]
MNIGSTAPSDFVRLLQHVQCHILRVLQTDGDPAMTSRLEHTWWFAALVSALALSSTGFLIHSAGLGLPATGLAQWIMYALCFFALHRGFAFAGWLLVLAL